MPAQEIIRLNSNLIPCLSKSGKAKNKKSDGITAQKIPIEYISTCLVSWVSKYNQTMASNEVTGKDMSMAPIKLDRLATSDDRAIKTLLIKIFKINLKVISPTFLFVRDSSHAFLGLIFDTKNKGRHI